MSIIATPDKRARINQIKASATRLNLASEAHKPSDDFGLTRYSFFYRNGSTTPIATVQCFYEALLFLRAFELGRNQRKARRLCA